MFSFSTTIGVTARITAVLSCVLATQATSVCKVSAQSRAQSHIATRSEKTSSPLVRFTDERGRTHYASDLDSVPAQFRSAAETSLELPEVTYKDHVIEQPLTQTSPMLLGDNPRNGQRSASKKGPANSNSRNSNDGTLDFIKYWLNFTADTFNKMASILNGK